jgi:hypothetical protein
VTGVTVNSVIPDRADDDAPPNGTAIVRPLRHVRAVRERYLLQFTDPSVAASPSVRAWAWALGETAAAPVTDRRTMVPPSAADIEAEITTADNRAGAAATVLRWLIGNDDHVPVRSKDRGELVGGFGDAVRSPEQIAAVLALAAEGQQRAAVQARDIDAGAKAFAQQDAGYLGGVVAALAWVLSQRAESPITRAHSRELTTRIIKMERVHAEDVIEQSRNPWVADRLPPLWYGEGVKFSINWLLGDSTAPPIDPAGRGPYGQGSELPAMLYNAKKRQRQF